MKRLRVPPLGKSLAPYGRLKLIWKLLLNVFNQKNVVVFMKRGPTITLDNF